MTSLAQTKAIHALRRSIPGFGDADYRAAVSRIKRGAISSKDLTFTQAGALIEELKKLGATAPARKASERADGPYAGKLRALWIALYHLGEVQNRDDRALIHFAKRQAGVDHTRFLTDAADARAVIEALKSWLKRAGVAADALDGGATADGDEVWGAKRAVAYAVAKRCFDEGAFTAFTPGAGFDAGHGAVWPTWVEGYGFNRGLPAGFEHYEAQHWDELSALLGNKLRKHRKAQAPAKKTKARAA